MAFTTENTATGDGSTTDFSFTFPYLNESDVQVTITDANGIPQSNTAFTFANATTLSFTSAPDSGRTIRIFRDTNLDNSVVTYFAGSAIRAEDLNDNQNQVLYSAQEVENNAILLTGGTMTGPLVLDDTTLQIQEGDHTLTIDAPTLTENRAVSFTDVGGNIVTTGDTGTVSRSMLADDAINAGKIADDSVDSQHYVAGSIDLEHMSANSVDSDQYVDGSIDRVHLAADVIDGTKIADDVVNSEHIAAGAVDLEHMSANSVDSDQYVDGSIDLAHMSANSVDSDQYVDGSIDGVHIADDAIDSQHYAAGSIDNEHLANNSVDSDQYVDGSIDSDHIGDGQVLYSKIQNISTDHRLLGRDNDSTATVTEVQVSTDMVVNDAITDAKLADSTDDDANRAVGTNHIKDSAVTSAKIADDTIVNADIKSDAAIAGSKINMSLNQLSDVNVGTPGSNQDDQVLAWDDANSEFSLTTVSSGGGGISDIVEDSSPQLGGNLNISENDSTHHSIVSQNNGSIVINPNGTGAIELGAATTVSTGDLTLSAGGVSTTGAASVFNEGGEDFDFRVEGDGQTHLLFVEAENDRVAINTNTTQVGKALTVSGDVGLSNGNTLSLMASSNNNTAELGYRGSISYEVRFPTALPTDANRFLRATGNTSPITLEFAEVDTTASVTTERLVNSTSTNTFTIAANTNVAMVGPLTINGSNTITVPTTSTFKIL